MDETATLSLQEDTMTAMSTLTAGPDDFAIEAIVPDFRSPQTGLASCAATIAEPAMREALALNAWEENRHAPAFTERQKSSPR